MGAAEGWSRIGRFVPRYALVVSVLLLVVLFVAALGSGQRGTGIALPTIEPTSAPDQSTDAPAAQPAPTPTTEPTSNAPPPAFAYGLGVVLVLSVLVVLWWVVRLLLRARRRRERVRVRRIVSDLEPDDDTASEEAVRDEVRSAVQEGLRETDDGDPRAAVIGCWLRLEQAAASAGTERQPGDTSTDLVTRLLDEHRISADGLDRLAELYRRARYAPDEVATAMRDEARETLSTLASELSRVGS